jgi:hypothetical protein
MAVKRHKVMVLAIFQRYIEADTLEEASGTAVNRVWAATDSVGLAADVVVPVPESFAAQVETLVSALWDANERSCFE